MVVFGLVLGAFMVKWAVGYLVLQGVGVYLWWAMLLLLPESRGPFLAPGAPDSTLLAFIGADLTVFGGGSLAAAYGLWHGRNWAWGVLCGVAGASVYGGLYAAGLPLLSGGGWLGALLMLPAIVVPPWLAWVFRPRK